MRPRQNGFSLLEFAVAGMVLGVLASILLDRLYYYQGLAEKTTVEMTVMNMRSGLRYKVADMLLRGKEAELAKLAEQSPVRWLASPPLQYLGARSVQDWAGMPPGSWVFDERRKELRYRVKHAQHFESARAGDAGLRYRVRLLKRALPEAGEESVVGAEIELVEKYRWFQPDE